MNFKINCPFHLFWPIHPAFVSDIGFNQIWWMPDGCCQYEIQVPTSTSGFALLWTSLVLTCVSDTAEMQSTELRPPSPHCSASTSGEESQNIHSHWTDDPHRWTREPANFSKTTHRNHDVSRRDLWMGKGGTFLRTSVPLCGQAERGSHNTKKPHHLTLTCLCSYQRLEVVCLRRCYCWVVFELFITLTLLKVKLVARISF